MRGPPARSLPGAAAGAVLRRPRGAVDGESWADRSRAWDAPPWSSPRSAPRRRLRRARRGSPSAGLCVGPSRRRAPPARPAAVTPCGAAPQPGEPGGPEGYGLRRRRRGRRKMAAGKSGGSSGELAFLEGTSMSALAGPPGPGNTEHGARDPRILDGSRGVGSEGGGGGGRGAPGRCRGGNGLRGRRLGGRGCERPGPVRAGERAGGSGREPGLHA